MYNRPIRTKAYCILAETSILLIGVCSTGLTCSSLSFLYNADNNSPINNTKKFHYIAAGCLVFLRLIIMCIAFCVCIVKEHTRDRDGNKVDDEDDARMQRPKPLRGYMNVLIGLTRVAALLAACLEFAYVSDKSFTVQASIVGSLFGSFCMTEFLTLLRKYEVIHPAFQSDLGYFKFVIAAALCAIQKIYGSGTHMAFNVIGCMILNVFSGVFLTLGCSRRILLQIDPPPPPSDH